MNKQDEKATKQLKHEDRQKHSSKESEHETNLTSRHATRTFFKKNRCDEEKLWGKNGVWGAF